MKLAGMGKGVDPGLLSEVLGHRRIADQAADKTADASMEAAIELVEQFRRTAGRIFV